MTAFLVICPNFMLSLRGLSLQRGIAPLLAKVDLTIHAGQKLGLVGANGCGKSTLFAAVRGVLAPEEGAIEMPPTISIAHLAQEVPALEQSAISYVLEGDKELYDIEQQLRAAEQKQDGYLIAQLHQQLDAIDGYSAKARAAQMLYGLGFTANQIELPVKAFSGGWRMRLNLAQTLMCRSDLLLLDEPTNHLDLDAVIWLEKVLQKYAGTLLLISHDKEFLDNVVDHIAYIERQQIKLYSGNYSAFEEQRAAQLILQQATYIKQQQKREHLMKFIDRFRAKASKAKQAQSRMKALAKMEQVEAAYVDTPFTFEFKTPYKLPNPLINLNQVKIGYDDKTILNQVNFQVLAGARIALLGPNGAGKTTLIRTLAGLITPQQGEVIISKDISIGYFAQHQLDQLQLDATPLEHMAKIAPEAREQDLRNYLGGFDFTGDAVKATIKNFSGGEKARLALALLVWHRPNLLLLDEPTNHLDLMMRHALATALQNYEGAMVVVSHDRNLIRLTTDQFFLVADGKVQSFTDDLDAYQQWLLNRQREIMSQNTAESTTSGKQDYAQTKLRRQLETRQQTLEKKITEIQGKIAEVENILADSSLYQSDRQALEKHLAKQRELKLQLETLEEEWLQIAEQLAKTD